MPGTKDQELRDVGLKATLPRLKVLEIMRASPSRHLSAEEVYRLLLEQDADVGLATVYRVLSQLEAAGRDQGAQAEQQQVAFDHLRVSPEKLWHPPGCIVLSAWFYLFASISLRLC